MADVETLRLRIAEAEDALHALTLGRKPQAVSSDSGSITYATATPEQLRAHIAMLKQDLALALGQPLRRTYFPGFGR